MVAGGFLCGRPVACRSVRRTQPHRCRGVPQRHSLPYRGTGGRFLDIWSPVRVRERKDFMCFSWFTHVCQSRLMPAHVVRVWAGPGCLVGVDVRPETPRDHRPEGGDREAEMFLQARELSAVPIAVTTFRMDYSASRSRSARLRGNDA